MRHLVVFGVGAVGGFFGGLLAAAEKNLDYKVSFIARGKTYQKLKSEGLELRRMGHADQDETIKQKINVYQSFADLEEPADVVFLCVKSRDTIAAAESMKDFLAENSFVVSVQNGVENEERLAQVLGEARVVGCLTNVAAENLAPGVYLQRAKHDIIMGELPQNISMFPERLIELQKIMRAAGINAKVVDDIYVALWSKLVWNAAFNPLSAYEKMELGPLIKKHQPTILGIMAEVKAVAEAQGIKLADDIVEWQFERTNIPSWESFKTSMLQDTLAGKDIELEELLGVIVSKGKELSVPTPNASEVYEKMKASIISVS